MSMARSTPALMAATLALVMVSCSGADTPRRETPQSDAPLS
jgi:hypothetical protein